MASSFKIAVDAMGGDFAPASVVRGAVAAARERELEVTLVGRRAEVERELGACGAEPGRCEVVDAPEVVGMDEPALTAIRKKKAASIRVAAERVREGRAAGMVSAGNTGAAMATAKLVIGCLEGVDRPALATLLPNPRGVSVLLDAGANLECRPEHLLQFAVMGHVYAREVLGVAAPRIGLLSVGEEETKGKEITREAHRILKRSGLEFIGNVEGRHLFSGDADVIVTDGFTGNVALKASESAAEALASMLEQEIGRTPLSRFGGMLLRPTFRRFKKRVDYAEYGGALLLGLEAVVVVCHGRSSARAIQSAIGLAQDFLLRGSNERIRVALGVLMRSGSEARVS